MKRWARVSTTKQIDKNQSDCYGHPTNLFDQCCAQGTHTEGTHMQTIFSQPYRNVFQIFCPNSPEQYSRDHNRNVLWVNSKPDFEEFVSNLRRTASSHMTDRVSKLWSTGPALSKGIFHRFLKQLPLQMEMTII